MPEMDSTQITLASMKFGKNSWDALGQFLSFVIILKTAVETRPKWPTVSNQQGLQSLMISPFW